jgi:hypothetical protein
MANPRICIQAECGVAFALGVLTNRRQTRIFFSVTQLALVNPSHLGFIVRKVALLTIALILVTLLAGCAGGEEAEVDETPPVISAVSVSKITETSATVTWTTDEPSHSQVYYGLTTNYGRDVYNLYTQLVTHHTINLTDLDPDTTYHYCVESRDASGNEAISGDSTFVTEATVPAHFVTYTDEAGFFSISYPSNWEAFPEWELSGVVARDFFEFYDPDDISIVGYYFIVFVAFSPKELDGSSVNVNIVVQPLSGDKPTLDEIVEEKPQRTEEISYEYHEFSRTKTTVGGREAIIANWEETAPDAGKKSRSVQMFMLADNLLFKVTCYVPSEHFNNYAQDLDAIVRSLRILR